MGENADFEVPLETPEWNFQKVQKPALALGLVELMEDQKREDSREEEKMKLPAKHEPRPGGLAEFIEYKSLRKRLAEHHRPRWQAFMDRIIARRNGQELAHQ